MFWFDICAFLQVTASYYQIVTWCEVLLGEVYVAIYKRALNSQEGLIHLILAFFLFCNSSGLGIGVILE